jgi:hypothetical protein
VRDARYHHRVIQRRALIGVVLAAAIPVLSGCGLEVSDETSKEQSSVQATDFSVGSIDVRDAFITYPAATSTTGTSRGYLVVTFVNNGTTIDEFTGATTSLGAVSVTGSGSAGPGSGNAASGAVTLLPGVPVAFGAPTLGSTGPTLRIAAGTPASVGTTVPVQFSFTTSGTGTAQLPIVNTLGETVLPTQSIPAPRSTDVLPSPAGLSPAND